MLLFTNPHDPSVVSNGSGASGDTRFDTSFDGRALEIAGALRPGQHVVSFREVSGAGLVSEVVGSTGIGDGDEPVSSFHLPPYYRWEDGGMSCRFVAEWREPPPSVAGALRHMGSLNGHPRALIVEDADRRPTLDGAPVSALVIGAPKPAAVPETGEPATLLDWRGWHVIDGEDPFDGPTRRVLATHTQVFLPR